MKISIDMIFINENKKIVTIHKLVPPCLADPCPSYSPTEPILYVVETVACRYTVSNKLKKGARVHWVR